MNESGTITATPALLYMPHVGLVCVDCHRVADAALRPSDGVGVTGAVSERASCGTPGAFGTLGNGTMGMIGSGITAAPHRPAMPSKCSFVVRSEEHTSELQSQSNLV